MLKPVSSTKTLESKYHDFGFIFWLHLLIILAFWLFPFLIDWRLVLLAMLIYSLQGYIWKAGNGVCPLTALQFQTRDPDASFYHYYLTKYLGLKLDQRKTTFTVAWIFPLIVSALSLIWQVWRDFEPLIF